MTIIFLPLTSFDYYTITIKFSLVAQSIFFIVSIYMQVTSWLSKLQVKAKTFRNMHFWPHWSLSFLWYAGTVILISRIFWVMINCISEITTAPTAFVQELQIFHFWVFFLMGKNALILSWEGDWNMNQKMWENKHFICEVNRSNNQWNYCCKCKVSSRTLN